MMAHAANVKDDLELHLIPGSRGRIVALLHLPAGAARKCPAIVFCHGFTGNHIEANRIAVRLGRAAAAAGIALLRFDFVGSGDSDGDFATDTYLSGWMQDLADVLDFARSQERIDGGRVATLGLSFGGATVLCLGTAGGKVRAVGCWAPVVRLVETFRDTILGRDLWEKLLAGEDVRSFYGKGHSLAPAFCADLLKHDVPSAAAKIPPAPVWIAHGDADRVIPVSHARELKEALGQSARLDVYPGADHVFTQHGEQLIEATLAWAQGALA